MRNASVFVDCEQWWCFSFLSMIMQPKMKRTQKIMPTFLHKSHTDGFHCFKKKRFNFQTQYMHVKYIRVARVYVYNLWIYRWHYSYLYLHYAFNHLKLLHFSISAVVKHNLHVTVFATNEMDNCVKEFAWYAFYAFICHSLCVCVNNFCKI